jgi:hypothetical protein
MAERHRYSPAVNESASAPPRARPDRFDIAVGVAAIVVVVVLVRLGLGLTFFADEWAVIADRAVTAPDLLRPFNEHWLAVTIVVYRGLLGLVGMDTYVPYLAFLAVLHALVALLVYALVRRRTLPGVAAGIALVVLLFGSGFENLFWGFQTGFVGATALCLWAIVTLRSGDGQPSRAQVGVAIGLLVAALATAGIAIAFIVGITVELLSDRRRRRLAPLLAIPLLVWAAWYLAIGRSAPGYASISIDGETRYVIARVVVDGFSNAAGAIFGLGPTFGLLAVVLIIVAAALRLRAHRLGPTFFGPIAAIYALYVVLGITRGTSEPEIASNPRFTYESGVLLLIGLAALIGPVQAVATRRSFVRWTALGGTLLAIALAFNVRLLIFGRELMLERADLTRALVTVALEPNPAGVDPNRSLIVVPSPASLQRIVARYGSPLTDTLAPDAVRPIPEDTLAEARTWLTEGPPPNITGTSAARTSRLRRL